MTHLFYGSIFPGLYMGYDSDYCNYINSIHCITMKELEINMNTFGLSQKVSTFDPNMEPLVPVGSTGTITKVYEDHPMGVGYDVLIQTSEGTVEDFFFHEFELTEVK